MQYSSRKINEGGLVSSFYFKQYMAIQKTFFLLIFISILSLAISFETKAAGEEGGNWQDITQTVTVDLSNPLRSRRNPDATVNITVLNSSSDNITGELRLVIANLTDNSALSIANATGETESGLPYFDLMPYVGNEFIKEAISDAITVKVAGGGRNTFSFNAVVEEWQKDEVIPELLTVKITSPETLITVGATPLAIQGTINDPDAALTLNGVLVQQSNGEFAASVALEEGHNTVLARAVAEDGTEITDSISVALDTTPPFITIESPLDGSTVNQESIPVSGLINDIVRGTVSEGQAAVSVNGISATVSNRSYLAKEISLTEGENTITVSGSDQQGNTASKTIQISYEVPKAKRIELVSGQDQTAKILSVLADPLKVKLVDGNSEPVADTNVIYRVIQGDGIAGVGSGDEGQGVLVKTDEEGVASTQFKLGTRSGEGNHKVRAKAVGFDGEIVFYASAENNPGNKVSVNSGNNQRGAPNQSLPQPLIVAVTDLGANLVQGAQIEFKVTSGGGVFQNGETSYTATTDSDGRATASFTLGDLVGLDVHRVTATLVGTSLNAGFTASALQIADPGLTSITGVVLDNQDNPLPNVTIRVDRSNRQSVTDDQGQFKITEAPVGPVHLIVDGSTTTVEGEWPTLSYNVVTIAGAENPLSAPVYMVKLDTENSVYVGKEDKELTLKEVPGFKLEVKAGSVTFPDGAKEGHLSVTTVNASKVPMAPPNGMQPQFIVTIQPAGAKFDPPAPLTLPNVDGHAPGAEVEMYSFDHDLEEFVAIGLGTVSSDGSLIKSNTGVGVVKAGWHCGSQPGGSGCANNCAECQKCDGDCNCIADDSQTPKSVTNLNNDCKKPACKGGSATEVTDDSDISSKDAKCNKCENKSIKPDTSKNGNKCGDGSAKQECLECKDGKCQVPECDADKAVISLSLAGEIDPKSIKGLGKVISLGEKLLNVLPMKCSVPTLSGKGQYKRGEECCQDCTKDDKGTFHEVNGGVELASDCVLGKALPQININKTFAAFGYGIQFELKAVAIGGVTATPQIKINAAGKYNLTCKEGCISGGGGLSAPVFGGFRAKITKAEAEAKFGASELDLVEVKGVKIQAGLDVEAFTGSVSAGFGDAAGCDAVSCKVGIGKGALKFSLVGGSIQLFDSEWLTLNLKKYINFELEIPLWPGAEKDFCAA